MIFKKRFNSEERALAVLWGLAAAWVIGPWALPLAAWVWLPWCMGGAGYGRVWRYAGCPALLVGAFLAAGRPWPEVVGAAATVVGFLPGYGVPDPPDRAGRDEGSAIGKFWYGVTLRQFPKAAWWEQEMIITAYTRATIAVIFALCYVPTWWSIGWRAAALNATLIFAFVLVALFVEGEFEV